MFKPNWKCPKCGSIDLYVVGKVLLQLLQHEDSKDEHGFETIPAVNNDGEYEWDHDSAMRCMRCHCRGKVAQFAAGGSTDAPCVVVVTNDPASVTGGITVWGDPPFKNAREAAEWVTSNPIVDLASVPWNIALLERTMEWDMADEAEESIAAGTHCPDHGCPGVLEANGDCSHCCRDYEDKNDKSPEPNR